MNKNILFTLLSLWCINCAPAAKKPASELKVCRFVHPKKHMTTYVQYNSKNHAETVSVHERKAKNGAVSYSGVRKKGKHTASLLIKADEAHRLFESFKKEHNARQKYTSSVNS